MAIKGNPTHLTEKQAKFCEKVLEGLNLSDAYRAAFNTENMKPATVNRAAKELADNPKVAARIEVLREGATRAAVTAAAYTLDEAMTDAEEDRALAREKGQGSAAVSATKLKAQLAGHLPEKEKRDARAGVLDELDVERLLEMQKQVEEKLQRTRAMLEATGASSNPPAPIRRIIG